jgi:hypothetical protein
MRGISRWSLQAVARALGLTSLRLLTHRHPSGDLLSEVGR